MSYVPTINHNTRCSTEAFCIANRAIIISSFASCEIWIFLHTVRMKARQALLLSFEAAAKVTARQYFLARIVHQVNTVSGAADLFEGWKHRR
jgi:hypothetical protein